MSVLRAQLQHHDNCNITKSRLKHNLSKWLNFFLLNFSLLPPSRRRRCAAGEGTEGGAASTSHWRRCTAGEGGGHGSATSAASTYARSCHMAAAQSSSGGRRGLPLARDSDQGGGRCGGAAAQPHHRAHPIQQPSGAAPMSCLPGRSRTPYQHREWLGRHYGDCWTCR